MGTISKLPQRPDVGRITLQSGKVVQLPLGWIVRWVDVEGREHCTKVLADCEEHIARLGVATKFDTFYEFLGEPKRVRI